MRTRKVHRSSFIVHRSFEYGHSCTISPFILLSPSPRLHCRMLAQMIADGLPQRAGAEAVNDADGLFAFEQRPVEELVRFFERIIDALADQIQLGGDWRD